MNQVTVFLWHIVLVIVGMIVVFKLAAWMGP